MTQAQQSCDTTIPKTSVPPNHDGTILGKGTLKGDGKSRSTQSGSDAAPATKSLAVDGPQDSRATLLPIATAVPPVKFPDSLDLETDDSSATSAVGETITSAMPATTDPQSSGVSDEKAVSGSSSAFANPVKPSPVVSAATPEVSVLQADDAVPASADKGESKTQSSLKAEHTTTALDMDLQGIRKATADSVFATKPASVPAKPAVSTADKPTFHEPAHGKPVTMNPEPSTVSNLLQARISPLPVTKTPAIPAANEIARSSDSKPESLHNPSIRSDATGKPQSVSAPTTAGHEKDSDSKGDSSQSSKDGASLGGTSFADHASVATPGSNPDATFGSVMSTHIAATGGQVQPTTTSATPKASELPATHTQAPTEAAVPQAEQVVSVAPSGIQAAKLVERMGQSELRVGIHAGEFGNVDIRTSMSHSNFTAQISVERGELGRVLAAELPSLHSRLSDQRLPVAEITVLNQSGNGSGNAHHGQSQNQAAAPYSPFSPEVETAVMPLMGADAIESGRLDVHM